VSVPLAVPGLLPLPRVRGDGSFVHIKIEFRACMYVCMHIHRCAHINMYACM